MRERDGDENALWAKTIRFLFFANVRCTALLKLTLAVGDAVGPAVGLLDGDVEGLEEGCCTVYGYKFTKKQIGICVQRILNRVYAHC